MSLAILLTASSFIAGKIALAALPPFGVVALRYGMAALIMWAIVLMTRRAIWFRGFAATVFAAGLLEGVAALGIYWGLSLTTAIHATVLVSLMPLMTTLLGRALLKEPITARVLAGSIIAFAGTLVLVVSGGETEASVIGDVMIASALFLVCLQLLILRRVAQVHGEPLVVTAYLLFGAALVGAGAGLLDQGADAFAARALGAGLEAWLAILYLAAGVSGATFFLFNYAVRHMPVGRITLYFVLIAPLGVPLAALVLGESISGRDIFAISLVVFGVALPALAFPAWGKRLFERHRAPPP